jgi:MFS family permease
VPWLKQLSDGIAKLSDIFNLGRLVFYTAAGALLVYPAVAGVAALKGPLRGEALGELVTAGEKLDWQAMLLASVVAGFVIAAYGFARVLTPAAPHVKAASESRPVDRRSYPFRYPQLRNGQNQDWDAWLIQEYFRFVEIVAYVPLGLLGGLAAVAVYAGAYVIAWAAGGHGVELGAPHVAFAAVAAAFAFCAFFVWPRFWVPRVVYPVLEAYHRAKEGLIDALDEAKVAPAAATARPSPNPGGQE